MVPPVATDVQGTMDTQAATFSDRLSVNGVPARRSKGPKIGGGIAAHSSSDMFKSPGYGKPKAKRWDHRINEESSSRMPSSLKGAAKYLKNPEDLISLGGGLPSSQYFPLEHIDIKVPTPPHFSEEDTKESGMLRTIGKHDIAEGKSLYVDWISANIEIRNGAYRGEPVFTRFLPRLLSRIPKIVHNPPYQDWQCCMTVGSTSALDMAYRMFTRRGEYLMTEEYTFSTAAETARPMGARWVGIKMDEEGLLPSHLDSVLSTWDPSARDGAPRPWLLYTVPSGQNPTGATQSLQRRKDIYRVAQKYDVYIIEDEPYFFLQMQPYTGSQAPDVPPPASHEEFLKALVPSLLSMDVDGRVMRLDSFSKVIAPGMRLGWITASEQIIERFVRHSETSTQTPSGASQAIMYKLLDESWGHSGYLDWLMNLRLEYTKRRDNICYACERYLPRAVASWNPPMAGMFHWIKVDWQKHPTRDSKSLLAIEDEIFHAAIEKGTLTSKGSWFRAETGNPGNDLFFRTTFAAASNEQIAEAIRRFGDALRAVFHLNSVTNSNGASV
ncbi:Aromatic/aminoadipate aminotransferase 1 [Lecanora helva]